MSAAAGATTAGPAHPGPLPRVPPRARGALLGLRLPGPAHGRARPGLPEPGAGADKRRGGRTGPTPRPRACRGAARSPELKARCSTDAAAARRSAPGEVALVLVPRRDRAVEYRFDADAAGEPDGPAAGGRRAAARRGPRATGAGARRQVQRARLPLHRLPGARASGHEPDGRRDLGHRLRDRGCAAQEAAQAADRDADVADPLPGVVHALPADAAGHRGGRAGRASRVLAFGVPLRGSLVSLLGICLLSALAFGALGLLVASRARTIEGGRGS